MRVNNGNRRLLSEFFSLSYCKPDQMECIVVWYPATGVFRQRIGMSHGVAGYVRE